MGVDFSHGEAHFGHSHFHSLRRDLAAMVGVRLDDMRGFGGTTDWATVTDPLAPLLGRNDAGGELTPGECRAAAARLRELLADPSRADLRDTLDELVGGLELAGALDEPFAILG